ncbi:MAG: hypothetical protein J7M09_07655 [Deltaproteobacteria bacterium]|nr:hypothetical protein [Candidatus Tharpella sp.]
MNISQIALNVGGGQEGSRRLSSPGLPRAPGAGKSEKVSTGAMHPESLSGSNSEPGVILDRGPVGRVVTVEWQEKMTISHSVGVADRAMAEIDEKVNEAKADLIEMTKMFPPYPHGSEERAELLNSYRSLRMQIDKLTFPPENELAAGILGESGDELLPPELQGFQVSSGKDGLNLFNPSVPVDEMEDADFLPVIDDLGRASALLHERRTDLRDTISAMFNKDDSDDDEALYIKLSLKLKEQLSLFDATMGREKTGLHNDLPHLDWAE